MRLADKVVLIILDGWGLAPAWGGNAIEMAQTPNMDVLWRKFPHTSLKAAEEFVGLPRHEMGNSEVGHLNIGCGQIVYQNLTGINSTITDGTFFTNEVLLKACNHVKTNNSALHLLGLFSDGGVHSHINHLFALLDLAKSQGINQVYVHAITDGRDTDPMEAYTFFEGFKNKVNGSGVGQIASIMGRYWAMDRDKHWERIQKAYDCILKGVAPTSDSPEKTIAENYRQNHTDEFITPTIIQTKANPFKPLSDNDALIFFNFRADRVKEITEAIINPNFNKFERKQLNNLYFATFSFLEEYVDTPLIHPAFELRDIQYPLARVLSDAGLSQLHVAETEKYAHVTYFFNGGKETLYPNEEHFLIPSPRVATYDLKPEMSAEKIKDKVLADYKNHDFTVLNFANPDMVGHTGNIKATIRACEVVDKYVGDLATKIMAAGGVAIITADHGNAEQKVDPTTGEPFTEHTTNPVPFILCSQNEVLQRPIRMPNGQPLILSDIAPTILELFGLAQPPEMTGKSLLMTQQEVNNNEK